MKRVLVTMLLAGIATVGISTGAHAAGNVNAKIMLHALATTAKAPCVRAQNIPTAGCPGYQAGVDNIALYPTLRYVYLLAVNGGWSTTPSSTDGIAGVQCGISYNPAATAGVDVYAWVACGDLQFASTGWPASGGGNLVTWNTGGTQCSTVPRLGNALVGAVAVAGYFYVGAYSPDLMRVVVRPVDGAAKVADCTAVEDVVTGGIDAETFMGAVGFGRPGINPCGRERVVGVEASTWSNVKNLIGTN